MSVGRFRTLGLAALAFVALGCVALAGSAAAQSAAPALSAADLALAEAFIATANSADPRVRDAFLARHMAAKPMLPPAEFPLILQRIGATSGGVRLTSASRRGRFIRLIVQAANGRTARIDLDVDPAAPDSLLGVLPVATPTPYGGPRLTAPASRSELAEAIDRRVRFSAERDDFSGAVLVMKGAEVIYQGAFGQADKDLGAPVTLDSRFNLGSMDKQFTAVAIAQLVEQGRLSLDSRLIDVLPDYPNRDAAQKITIRHLLTHSAGLGMLWERPKWERLTTFRRMSDLLPVFAAEPLAFEPGTQSDYANEGFLVLGAVVEKVSGQSWYDYVQKNVFDRAGMSHTGYPALDEIAPGRAVGYRFGDDDPLGFGARRPNWTIAVWRGNACGGGYSTVGDMIRFLQALRDGRLIKPETAALFTTAAPHGLADYGMGFENARAANGRTIRGHNGGGPQSGINSEAKIVWETGYAYAVLGNYDAPFAQALGGDIAEMLALQD